MSAWSWLRIALGVTLLLYASVVAALALAGRRGDALAVARFVPDCVVLFTRLLGDPRVARWRKALLLVVLAYLASPIDVVPDFLPVIGQLDDALIVVLVSSSVKPACFATSTATSPIVRTGSGISLMYAR